MNYINKNKNSHFSPAVQSTQMVIWASNETVINEFKIACSVASILLTTSRIIINENENKRIEY